MKKILIITISFLLIKSFSLTLVAQKGIEDGSRFGHGEDSIKCRQNISLYSEYYRQRDYVYAYKFWKPVFTDCPYSSKNVFIQGEKLLKDKIEREKDATIRSNLIDTLMMLFDQRIEIFGEKGKVRGRQGVALLNYRRTDDVRFIQQAYDYLQESIELEKGRTSDAVLATFYTASLSLYQNKVFSSRKAIDDYFLAKHVLTIKTRGKIEELDKNFDNLFIHDGPSNCDTIIACFSEIYDTKKTDKEFLALLTTILKKQNCIKKPLFYQASVDLYNLEPSSKSAENIALLAADKEDYPEAVKYYKEAAELETDAVNKARYYYGVALAYKKMKSKESARTFARKAIQTDLNYGEPYLLIAQLYVEYKDACSSIKLPRAVYWVAVDQCNKAKTVDNSSTEKANKLILSYSKMYPSKEEAFFLSIYEGDSYLVECWINETTKVRFNE